MYVYACVYELSIEATYSEAAAAASALTPIVCITTMERHVEKRVCACVCVVHTNTYIHTYSINKP